MCVGEEKNIDKNRRITKRQIISLTGKRVNRMASIACQNQMRAGHFAANCWL